MRLAPLFAAFVVATPALAQYYPPQPPPPQGYYPPQQPPPGYYPPPQQPYYAPPPPRRYYPPQRVYVEPPPARRIIGFGTSLAGGSITTLDNGNGDFCSDCSVNAFVIGDLSVYLPLSPRFEIQAWVPLLTLALHNNGGFNANFFSPSFWGDVFIKIYTRGNAAGFFIAPGIGGWYFGDPSGGGNTFSAFEIPFRIGFDLASPGRGFALSLAARPWLDIISANNGGGSTIGIGGMFEAQVNFYLTR